MKINAELAQLLQLPRNTTEATLVMRASHVPVLTVTQLITELEPGAVALASRTLQFELRPVETAATAAPPFDLDALVEAAQQRLAAFIDERCRSAIIGMQFAAGFRAMKLADMASRAVRGRQ